MARHMRRNRRKFMVTELEIAIKTELDILIEEKKFTEEEALEWMHKFRTVGLFDIACRGKPWYLKEVTPVGEKLKAVVLRRISPSKYKEMKAKKRDELKKRLTVPKS